MIESPLISVIMPVFNAEIRLNVSIDSVLNQTYRNFELILINDGSTDRSGDICNQYAKRDHRVIVIHQKNAGVSTARNVGINIAKGEYIAFVDSDDTIEPQTYDKVIVELSKGKVDLVIFGMSFDYYKSEKFVRNTIKSTDQNLNIESDVLKNYFFQLFDRNYLSSVWNKVIKTSVIRENKILFEKRMSILEDFKFVLDILEYTKTIVVLKDVFYRYYNNLAVSSLTRRPNIDYTENFWILNQRLKSISEIMGLDEGENNRKINCLILRFYIIGIEKLFSSNEISSSQRTKKLRKYVYDSRVQESLNLAKCMGFRLKIVRFFMKTKQIDILTLLFIINALIKISKTKIL